MSVGLLPHERIDLAIYRSVQAQGGRSRPALIGSFVTGVASRLALSDLAFDQYRVVERLEFLYSEERILLKKYVGTKPFSYQQFCDLVRYVELGPNLNQPSHFFQTGGFEIEITAKGRQYFEELEAKEVQEHQPRLDAAPPGRPRVFISCGQVGDEEKSVGRKLAAAVNEMTGCEGYFAQNQNSLEAMSRHIFMALNDAVGFVAVMHHRGTVTGLNEQTHIRASLWIEQELAIAAFLAQAQDKSIPAAVYIQKGIKREGVREQLLLNDVVEFEAADQVVKDFRERLSDGRFRPAIPGPPLTEPLDPAVMARVKEKWRQLSPADREAVRHLIDDDRLTCDQALRELQSKGLALNYVHIYEGIASETNLVERVSKTPGPTEHIQGYTGQWMINPKFRPAVERIAREERSSVSKAV